MPIWNPDCTDHDRECQTIIGNLSVIANDVWPALLAPCDAFAATMRPAADRLLRRLDSQAKVWLKRLQALADQLPALPALPLPDLTGEMPANPPGFVQDVSGDATLFQPVQDIQIAPETRLDVPVPIGERVTPVDMDEPAAYLFGEGAARWHAKAAAWYPVRYGRPLEYATALDFMWSSPAAAPAGLYPPPDIEE
jgi:hypothetical protein